MWSEIRLAFGGGLNYTMLENNGVSSLQNCFLVHPLEQNDAEGSQTPKLQQNPPKLQLCEYFVYIKKILKA